MGASRGSEKSVQLNSGLLAATQHKAGRREKHSEAHRNLVKSEDMCSHNKINKTITVLVRYNGQPSTTANSLATYLSGCLKKSFTHYEARHGKWLPQLV